jgi:hypothetical protein
VDVHPSALRYGEAIDDSEHAVRNAMAIDELDDDVRLYLGQGAMALCSRSSRWPRKTVMW